MKKELHILIGCADARDLNHIQIQAVADKRKAFLEKGIAVDLQVIRAAGSFAGNDVFNDVKHIILQFMKEQLEPGDESSYFIHVQSHGHLTEDSKKDYVSHVFDMRIVEGSALNCGMLGASGVGIELEQLILQQKPVYKSRGEQKQVVHENDIRQMLKEVYAYDGYLAGDWIKSIDFLRTHPRTQKARLEELINHDPDLKRLGIQITAGIQDYAIHALIRVDGGKPEAPFWDEVQMEIRELSKKELESLKLQSAKQKPLAGLLCMADPKTTSRTLAASYYYKYKNMEAPDGYLPNTIFNITGSLFDIPETPFGPYVIAGFFYAVKHLQLSDQIIMGHDEAQTGRILQKIKNDPLMNMIVQTFQVNLIPLHQKSLL